MLSSVLRAQHAQDKQSHHQSKLLTKNVPAMVNIDNFCEKIVTEKAAILFTGLERIGAPIYPKLPSV